jgi:hypothetical protein
VAKGKFEEKIKTPTLWGMYREANRPQKHFSGRWHLPSRVQSRTILVGGSPRTRLSFDVAEMVRGGQPSHPLASRARITERTFLEEEQPERQRACPHFPINFRATIWCSKPKIALGRHAARLAYCREAGLDHSHRRIPERCTPRYVHIEMFEKTLTRRLGLPGRVREVSETLRWSDVEFVNKKGGVAVRINFSHHKGYRNPNKDGSRYADAGEHSSFCPQWPSDWSLSCRLSSSASPMSGDCLCRHWSRF